MPSQRLSSALIFLCLSITPLHPQDTVRRLTSDEAIRAATAKPQPDYPPVARQLRIQGRVDVEVSIDPTGTVESTRIVAGNAALTGTIANTLKRWHFEPALVDGKPVRAIATISFTFKL